MYITKNKTNRAKIKIHKMMLRLVPVMGISISLIFFILIASLTKDLKFVAPDYEGLTVFVEIFKIPLNSLLVTLTFWGILVAYSNYVELIEQNSKQNSFNRTNINISNYYKILDGFIKDINLFIDDQKSMNKNSVFGTISLEPINEYFIRSLFFEWFGRDHSKSLSINPETYKMVVSLYKTCYKNHEELFDLKHSSFNLRHPIFKNSVFYKIAPNTANAFSREDFIRQTAQVSLILSLCKRALSIVGQKVNYEREVYSKLSVP